MTRRTRPTTLPIGTWKPAIGTLAHNRRFTASEITEYTRFDRRLDGPAVVRALLKAGYIQRVKRGLYYPTSAGWNWLEDSK